MVKVKSNRDKLALGVLVTGGELRHFTKKDQVLDLTKKEMETFSVEVHLENGMLELVDTKSTKKKESTDAKATKSEAFSEDK